MPHSIDRRSFLKSASAGLGAGLVVPAVASAAPAIRLQAGPAADRVRVAIMGVNSRGAQLAKAFLNTPGAVITTICDVDTRAAARAIEMIAAAGGGTPVAMPDIRKVVESRDVDAVAIAAPDHWHAPAAILALNAGKHVYVEKPCSHNPAEGELLVATQKRTGKVVQMGNQRRSWPNVQKAIALVHGGRIGRVYNARTWYANSRASIGLGKPAAVPPWLDFELWQGPAPRRPLGSCCCGPPGPRCSTDSGRACRATIRGPSTSPRSSASTCRAASGQR